MARVSGWFTLEPASVAKPLDTERGTRARGFADSTARKTERRIIMVCYMECTGRFKSNWSSPSGEKKLVLGGFGRKDLAGDSEIAYLIRCPRVNGSSGFWPVCLDV